MVVWKNIKKAVHKEPVTSISLGTTVLILALINLGVIKPLYVEIELTRLSILGTTAGQIVFISLSSILILLIVIFAIILIYRLWRSKK